MATANLNDMATLATDAVFGNRVLVSLTEFCTTSVANETITASSATPASVQASINLHIARKNYASAVLNNPSFYKPLFVNAAAANQTVANDATAGGTLVSMTPAQLATAALLCTDIDINNAVAAAFNAFVSSI
jgi:hypothetical protein